MMTRKPERQRERERENVFLPVYDNRYKWGTKKKIYLNEKEKCSSNEFNKGKIKMRNTKKNGQKESE